MSDGPHGYPSPGDPQQPGSPAQPGYPQQPAYPPPPGYPQASPPPQSQPPQAPQSPAHPQTPQPPQAPGYPPPQAYPQQPEYPPTPGYAPPPMPGPGGYAPAPQKSSNKGLWIGLGIGALVLALLCCGGLAIAVINGINSAQDEIERLEEESRAPLPSDGIPTEEATPAGDATGTVGTPIRLTNLELTVTAKPACAATPLGTGSNRAEPLRGKFCQVPLRLVNKGSDSVNWPCIRATLTSAKAPKNFYSTTGHRALSNGAGCNVDVAASATWDGKLVFDLDTDDTAQKLVFTEDYRGFATVTL